MWTGSACCRRFMLLSTISFYLPSYPLLPSMRDEQRSQRAGNSILLGYMRWRWRREKTPDDAPDSILKGSSVLNRNLKPVKSFLESDHFFFSGIQPTGPYNGWSGSMTIGSSGWGSREGGLIITPNSYPQFVQNFAPSLFWVLHFGQIRIFLTSSKNTDQDSYELYFSPVPRYVPIYPLISIIKKIRIRRDLRLWIQHPSSAYNRFTLHSPRLPFHRRRNRVTLLCCTNQTSVSNIYCLHSCTTVDLWYYYDIAWKR